MNAQFITLILASLSSVLLVHGEDDCPTNDKVLFCYYANWAVYRNDIGVFTIDDIEPSLCTHLIYAFSGLSEYGGLESLDPYYDVTSGGFTNFTSLKTKNKCLKTLLAIGGWNEGSRKYSVLVSEERYRQAFIDSVIRHLVQYDFDGLDFDWEYPSERGGISQDRENYGLLLKELKATLSKWGLLLTIAVPISTSLIDAGYDVAAINSSVDYVLIMGYDFTATDSNTTGWLSPLNEIDKTVNAWKQSVDSHKIVLGVPAYGRSFTLNSSDSFGIGAPAQGAGEAGYYTREPGFLSYLEVQSKVQSGAYKIVRNETTQNYYAYYTDGLDWICFETEENYIAKANYVMDNDLGGAMVWSIDTDEFYGELNSTFAVVNSLRKVLFSN